MSLSAEMSFTVLCLYRPPSAKVDFYDQFKVLLSCCDFNNEVILIGDLNINWDNKSDKKKLKEITDHFGLTQMINDSTRITNRSKTLIDLVFSNIPDRMIKTYNFLTGLSDHNAIFFF